MKCQSCGFESPEASKFCGKCGSVLSETCSSCGQTVEVGLKFCTFCGHTLTPAEVEKTRLINLEDEPGETNVGPFQAFPYLQKEDGSKIEIKKNKIIAGREKKCELLLESLETSARHARLEKTQEGYLLTDLRSTNGTYVNNGPISAAILRDGDQISFGPENFVFHDQPEEDPFVTKPLQAPEIEAPATIIRDMPWIEEQKVETPQPPPEAAEVMEKSLDELPFLIGKDGEIIYIEKDKIVIGRNEDNDVVLSFPGVSEKHAGIEKTAAGYVITDLNSTNGTFVNGKFSTKTIVQEGDSLVIGTEAFSFHEKRIEPAQPPEEAAAIPPPEPAPPVPDPSGRLVALTTEQVQLLAKKMEKGMPSPIIKSSDLAIVLLADEKLTWAGQCMSSWYFGPDQRREIYVGATHLRFIVYYISPIGSNACQSYWYDVDFGGLTWKSGFKTWRGFTVAPPEFMKKKIDLFPQKIRDDGKIKTLFVALPLESLKVPVTQDGKEKFKKDPEGFFETLQQSYENRKPVNPAAVLTLLKDPPKAAKIPGAAV